MATKNSEERLRRLERLATLSFVETHGLRPELSGTAIGSLRGLRAQCALDTAAILREHQEPPVETRVAS